MIRVQGPDLITKPQLFSLSMRLRQSHCDDDLVVKLTVIIITVDASWIQELLQRAMEHIRPSDIPGVGSRHHTQIHADRGKGVRGRKIRLHRGPYHVLSKSSSVVLLSQAPWS